MIDLQQIKGAEESGRKAKVADFGHQVEDPQFLNALQSGVNRWIREIQKVGYAATAVPQLCDVVIDSGLTAR